MRDEFLPAEGPREGHEITTADGRGFAITAIVPSRFVAFYLYVVRGDIPSNDDATDGFLRGFEATFPTTAILVFTDPIHNGAVGLVPPTFVTD